MSADMVVLAIPGNTFPRTIVERAFASCRRDQESDDWYLYRPSEEAAILHMLVGEGEMIDGFSINRPPDYDGFPEFWDAVFEMMRNTPTYCLIAGGGWKQNCCVVQADIISEEMIQFAGGRDRVRVASSGEELAEAAWE